MAVERTPSGSSLIDVLDRVLDKGIVIDAKSGVTGTPSFFINGVRHEGGWDEISLSHAIEAALR